jgi:outer membrane protein OmpA-like peptidoglycan-associated protein
MRRRAALLALTLISLSGCAGASGEVALQYQPAVPRYIVTYSPAASGLDANGAALVSQAAQAALKDPNATVQVVGYSSTASMGEADQMLSEERATTVMNQLVADGVPAARVTSMTSGATTYQFSPTEARRVEIDIVHAGF